MASPTLHFSEVRRVNIGRRPEICFCILSKSCGGTPLTAIMAMILALGNELISLCRAA
jgi:hypothetical protein